ncbi:hypothetical protein [Peribacillus deserti]|uniref:Uncharacterized protein n=1 Tax=Peribacillus deserti TaxID=673318 RepID=A0A2N5M3Z7_9BACI|nr:hypothetical protein [Peribacillus deserti]PLT29084.1 hypothetical protein CUU66_14795 [Peribacillus deserti]
MSKVNQRKRYSVVVEGNGKIEHAVIIAESLDLMYWQVHKLYGHLLKDEDGRDVGKVSFVESALT